MGWDAQWEELTLILSTETVDRARVIREDRGRYDVMTESGPRGAVVSGRLIHETLERADFPAVGDWVVGKGDTDGPWLIQSVLPRRSQFSRKAVGGSSEAQVVAANVDRIFLVTALPEDFNERRLERYLLLAWNSGARPHVVLNKVDRVTEGETWLQRAATVAFDTPIHLCSALNGAGVDELAAALQPGETVALLGSSGVGKSALCNALLGLDEGKEEARTGAIRAGDGRGRHTTSHRQIHMLPSGALLMDTPGMRELQLWADEEEVDAAFADIEELAWNCRFGDCNHEAEPGCAVREALEAGSLDPDRFRSWSKLQREARRLAVRKEERARQDDRKRWKQRSKDIRQWRKIGPKSDDPRTRR